HRRVRGADGRQRAVVLPGLPGHRLPRLHPGAYAGHVQWQRDRAGVPRCAAVLLRRRHPAVTASTHPVTRPATRPKTSPRRASGHRETYWPYLLPMAIGFVVIVLVPLGANVAI